MLVPDSTAADRWQRPDLLRNSAGELCLTAQPLRDLARAHGTPAFHYSAPRIRSNVERLREAVSRIRAPVALYYAAKANRYPPLLQLMRSQGLGLDVCSPAEVRLGLENGYQQAQMSLTAGSLSQADFDALAGWPELWVNCDSLTGISELGRRCPGRAIGIRINPGIGVGYRDNPLVAYAGQRPTKFGVYLDRFAEALGRAQAHGLAVTTLHCHAGCGYLSPALERLEQVLGRLEQFLALAPTVERVNLGGGLGIPLVADDVPLDLPAWAALIDRRLGGRGLALAFEPGDYLVKDAGLLLTEVTQDEVKGGVRFVGVNAGFNLHPAPAHYQMPLLPVVVDPIADGSPVTPATIVGNINEALDVFNVDVLLPALKPGALIALLNAGGYGSSMASNHCLRGHYTEHLHHLADYDAAALDRSNRVAWDALYGATSERVWGDGVAAFLVDELPLARERLAHPGSRALDAGTGEGRNLAFLLDAGASEVHGVDASAQALAKVADHVRERVQLRHATLDQTGYPDQHFDLVLLIDVYETLPAAAGVLREMARVLKPGGSMIVNVAALEDGIAGDQMRALAAHEYLYQDRYYFHFMEAAEASAAFAAFGLDCERCARRAWVEQGHPGFREGVHTHVSHVFWLRRQP